jgi:hypothetical protein
MKVFTEEWVAQLEKRYGRLPEYQRPVIYTVATGDHNQPVRLKIEDWLVDLALQPAVERELIRRLRSPEHFIHTYHELIFADILQRRGFALEYEKQMDGLTPDWFVGAKSEIPAFILEVFTANISDTRNSERHQISQLRSRLQEIQVGVALDIHSEKLIVELDNRRSRGIATKVRNWLVNMPPVGAQLEVDEFTFEIVHYNSNYNSVQPIGPVSTFMVNSQPVRINFQEKISKYRKVATENRLPLVVGVIADFYTGIGFDDLEIIVLGRTTEEILYDEETGKAIGREITRTKDGLFAKEAALSAVIWAERLSADQTSVRAIHNPTATNPLPEGTFI